ncbi:hypothetical protein AVEN_125335-1 [Araneus ventricosus]|uniref:Uncharacterized protein n=1 Tax=Araneus ventricosus TaxID=182803 RepID=A0A4Y2IE44_ARAVE|nr:hypothetical protein AVEN_125335-1 [Araneus ventricosus]
MFFTYELLPFPLSLFSEEGMRKGTKSFLFSAFTPTKIDAVEGKNNFVAVNGGHLLHKVVWQRNMNFEDMVKSYLTYLQTHYGSNVAVVFDGYPSDETGRSTKSAEHIQRTNLHSSPEIIFNKATCSKNSQKQFLADERNKVRFIDLLKKFLQKANVIVKQAVEDADILVVETAVSVRSQYDNIFVKKTVTWKNKIQVFFNSEATIDQVAKAGQTFLVHLYGGNPRTSARDLNHLHYTLFTQSSTKARSTLARLPLTIDAARFRALRSYLQIQKWLGHEKNHLEWGWVPTRFDLSPRKMERGAAPDSLLKMMYCNCNKGCKNACGCRKQVLYVLPCALVLWEKLVKTCQTSIYLSTALKMKTTSHRQEITLYTRI